VASEKQLGADHPTLFKRAHCINILKIVGGLTGRFCGPPKKFGGFRE
jgi:hypothetical protein